MKKMFDQKEIELPDTVYVRDIETKVLQSIALQCLAQIEGIALQEGSFLDSLFGRDASNVKGVSVDQDSKNHSVNVRVEINVAFGLKLPEKAEEIQQKITEEITNLTGLHVGSVHVVFKNLIPEKAEEEEVEESVDEEISVEEIPLAEEKI